MADEITFWTIDSEEGQPDLWVCMSCLSEAYRGKVPMPDCPTCHGVSTYEAFSLDSIRDWGTEELIAKAVAAQSEVRTPSPQTSGVPAPDTTE